VVLCIEKTIQTKIKLPNKICYLSTLDLPVVPGLGGVPVPVVAEADVPVPTVVANGGPDRRTKHIIL
jgi:hypothetical protein